VYSIRVPKAPVIRISYKCELMKRELLRIRGESIHFFEVIALPLEPFP
jgi:hypothetical protein